MTERYFTDKKIALAGLFPESVEVLIDRPYQSLKVDQYGIESSINNWHLFTLDPL